MFDNEAVKENPTRQEKIDSNSESDDGFPPPPANRSMESSEDMFDSLIGKVRDEPEAKPVEQKKKNPPKRKLLPKKPTQDSDDDVFSQMKNRDSDDESDDYTTAKKTKKAKKKKISSDEEFGSKQKKGKKKKKSSSDEEFEIKESKGKKKKKAVPSDDDFAGGLSETEKEIESPIAKPSRAGRAVKQSNYVFDDSDESI